MLNAVFVFKCFMILLYSKILYNRFDKCLCVIQYFKVNRVITNPSRFMYRKMCTFL